MTKKKESATLYTTAEVAEIFGVHSKTVCRWAKEDRIPSFQTPGGAYRFSKTEIDEIRKSINP